jgi:hypothetical protein
VKDRLEEAEQAAFFSPLQKRIDWRWLFTKEAAWYRAAISGSGSKFEGASVAISSPGPGPRRQADFIQHLLSMLAGSRSTQG